MNLPAPSCGVTLLYDFLHVRGGAERVTMDLLQHLPRARAWFAARATDAFADGSCDGARFLSAVALPRNAVARALLATVAFRMARARFARDEAVLFSGHYAPLAACAADAQRRIFYAHGAPLAIDSALLQHDSRLLAVGRRFERWYRPRFAQALGCMHRRFANSRFNAALYEDQYDMPFEVLSPPCAIEKFHWAPSDGYFLSFARQEPDKRVHLAVEAMASLPNERLVVASDGSQHASLVAMATPNVQFVRSTDADDVAALLARCRATLYVPANEPFGLSAVESLAAGKPVVAVDEGGLPEIVRHGDTGWLLPRGAPLQPLVDLLATLDDAACERRRDACERASQRFAWQPFLAQLCAAFDGAGR